MAILVPAALQLGIATAAGATDLLWDGGGADDNWSTSANWNPDQAPVNEDFLMFGGTTRLAPINDFTSFQVRFLDFSPGAGPFVLGGAPLILDSSDPTYAALIINESSSTQTLNNALTLLDTTSISSFNGPIVLNGPIATSAVPRLYLDASAPITVNGAISGPGNVFVGGEFVGISTVTFLGANTYTGSTVVTSGARLIAGANDVLNLNSALSVNGGVVDIGSFSQSARGVTLTSGQIVGTTGVLDGGIGYTVESGIVSAILGGSGQLTKSTTGTLTLSGANTYTGRTLIQDGTVSLGAAERISNASALNVTAPAQLRLNGFNETVASLAGAGTVNLGAGVLGIAGSATTTFNGLLTGTTGGLSTSGTGTLTLGGTATNVYAGATTVSGGTLALSGSNRLPDASALVVNGVGTFDLAGNSETVASLAGSGNVALGTGKLTLRQSSTTTFSGAISGAGELVKDGAGALTLNGALAYSGPTSVLAGSLVLSNGLASPGGLISVGSAGALQAAGSLDRVVANDGSIRGPSAAGQQLVLSEDVTGIGAYSGNIRFSGRFSPGASPALVHLENVAFDATSELVMEILGVSAGSGFDKLLATGTATLDGTLRVALSGFTPHLGDVFDLIEASAITGTFAAIELPSLATGEWQTVQSPTRFSLQVIPEPGSLILFAAGLAALACRRRLASTS